MPDLESLEINPWAALVAALASFVVGGVWYAALFGRAWARVYRFDQATLDAMAARQGRTLVWLAACDLVSAAALALVFVMAGVGSAPQGVALGGLVWLATHGTLGLATHIASARPAAGFVIDGGRQLASLLVMGAILGSWR